MKFVKFAFTMIELIFVIVIIGVLSAIAVPKFKGIRDQADISKGRADVSAIQSAILSERQSRLVKGQTGWISYLTDPADANTTLFKNNSLLLYGIKAGTTSGHWNRTGAHTYDYIVDDTNVTFTYDPTNGTFTCSTTGGTTKQNTYCKELTN